MPDDPDDVVRRAFLLDHAPPLSSLQPPKLQLPDRTIPPHFDPFHAGRAPAAVEPLDPEQIERVRSVVQTVHAALVEFARALGVAVRAIVESFQRAFPAALLVELADAARYERRMEAHRHRTAGRPRSRMRPGRMRRRHT